MTPEKKEAPSLIWPTVAMALGVFLIVTKSVSHRFVHTEGAIVAFAGILFFLVGICDFVRALCGRRKKEPIQLPETTRGK